MEGDSGQPGPVDQSNNLNGAVTQNVPAEGQPILPTPQVSTPSAGPKLGRKLSLPLIIALIVILLLGGSAAAYFGYVVPNKPQNVWKSALENTADGYDGLVDYTERLQQEKRLAKIKAKGGLKLSGVANGDGNVEMVADEKNAKLNVDFGFAGSRYGIEALLNVPEGSETPDAYFKVTGLEGLGALLGASPYADAAPFFNSLNNQWIFVDHTLFDQYVSQAGTLAFKPEDTIVIANKIGDINREYLFASAEDKRVLTVVREVGKEERDGRSVYHYEVGFHKENLKKYVRALKDGLKETKVKDLLESTGQSYDEAFDVDGLLREIDELKGDETADVWVDMKTKLIRVVRFTDSDHEGNYMEISIPYNGGDEVPFAILFSSDEEGDAGSVKLGLTVNKSTDVSKLDFDMNYEMSGQKQTIKGDFTIEPSNETVEFTKPEGVKSITEILGALFGGLTGGLDQPQLVDPSGGLPVNGLEL